jgi:hypothetical protein
MRKQEPIITTTQAKQLFELGYDGYLVMIKGYKLAMIDDVIDWLRRKYNIHVYTAMEPFVDPTTENKPVLYRFAVKYCNQRDGWNGRIYIGETKLSPNVYTLKKQAITLALRWIKNKNVKKLSK